MDSHPVRLRCCYRSKMLHSCVVVLLMAAAMYTVVAPSDVNKLWRKTSNGTSRYRVDDEPHPPPSFSTPAGVIMFYHLFKTGGVTIRANFRKIPNVQFKRLMHYEGLNWTKYNVEPILLRQHDNKNRTLLVEWHIDHPAPGYPTLLDLEPHFKRWRKMAQQNGVPLFVFSLLRDPLAFPVSYFNQFNAYPRHYAWNPYPEVVNATEQNFIQSFVPNRQCLILAASPTGVALNRPVSKKECRRVQKVFTNNFDWVGTAERLQTETIPLLLHFLSKDNYVSRLKTYNQVSDKGGSHLFQDDLSNETVAMVKDGSDLDQQLYDSMLEAFPIERMKSIYGWTEGSSR